MTPLQKETLKSIKAGNVRKIIIFRQSGPKVKLEGARLNIINSLIKKGLVEIRFAPGGLRVLGIYMLTDAGREELSRLEESA
ncbi:hypothetical protein [Pararhodospirillum photometricum]|uniref:hypothetical protein n=1 Tax=Pararhodospirillum photometricum TaxID=1084 RepID=UPI0002E30662|nr:hypothetical protein [Pararhodospirillum photometricum]